jgi:4-hydroxyphenylpyruvate dioxygenase
MNPVTEREALAEGHNPLGIEGVEYVEYHTARPQALGHVLELMGFRPVARHRSREVLLYRQGGMNLIVNAHAGPGGAMPEHPRLAALALRVRDAAAAHRHALSLGAWDVPVRVQPMELHIPGIRGVGASRLYFVDRWREFSIYDVDFVPVPGVDSRPPALAGLHGYGVVQYIGLARTEEWVAFYRSILGFELMGEDRETGVLPSGCVLRSPDGSLHLQLIEPAGDMADGEEWLQRLAFGTADVPAAAAALRSRGVQFVDTAALHVEVRGALTQSWLGGLMFELVHHDEPASSTR